ncbi:NAD(P)H-dependent oxidoreductase [Lewinellaceae bacterium SD302]|nr:NAD(P)H-dependent oxidoreductase [Lewinellaceae bacterium SD302]
MHHLLEKLNWRYATKQFDPNKQVGDQDLEIMQRSVRLAATSYGLQPFRVVMVNDPEVREQLKSAAYGQSQITDASHLAVFCAKTDMSPEYVDDYMARLATARNLPISAVEGFGNTIKGQVDSMDAATITAWNKRQTYIALGHWLIAAAELHIDCCPMEGFDAEKFDEILGLKEQGLTATVVAPIGYRSEEDAMAKAAKVRLPLEKLFINK